MVNEDAESQMSVEFTSHTRAGSTVHSDFDRARRRAFVQDILASLRNAPADLLPFDQVRQKLHLDSQTYRGLEDVPLDRIVGSVGRYFDFNRAFLPRHSASRQRWQGVLTLQGRVPPVDLYKVGDVYFVVDGNHRVSTARQTGGWAIGAQVWEYPTRVPLEPETTFDELLIKKEYVEFLQHTYLDTSRPEQYIELTSPGGYRELEYQIALCQAALSQIDGRPLDYKEAAACWYDMIYIPVLQIVCQKDILKYFPGRTEADLLVWVSRRQQELSEAYGYTVPITEAINHLLARRGIKWPRRLFFALRERLLGQSRRRRTSCRM
jgi:hypothetical protein